MNFRVILGKCYPLRYQEAALPEEFAVTAHSNLEEDAQHSDMDSCDSDEYTTDEDEEDC